MKSSIRKQQGSVLLVAIMLLVIATIVSLTTMRSNITEQQMAVNYQAKMEAFQCAQSAMDYIISYAMSTKPSLIPVIGNANTKVSCTANLSSASVSCPTLTSDNTISLPSPPFNSTYNSLSIAILNFGAGTGGGSLPPRFLETSAKDFGMAYFNAVSSCDRSAERQGKSSISTGLMKLIKKA